MDNIDTPLPLFSTDLEEKKIHVFQLSKYLDNNNTCFIDLFGIFEANAREYFQGAWDPFLVPATKVRETIWMLSGM